VIQKILVVDDEAPARERLERMLKSLDPNAIIDSATNGYEALEKINNSPPDILFLDIQMPEMSGFDILRNIENRSFSVIFQTAYDQFAIDAFEESACDYLLKPFELERLRKAYQKAIVEKANKHTYRIDQILQNKGQFIDKLNVREGSSLFQIPIDKISFFISKDHYTCAYIGEREYVIDLSLSYLENQLDPKKFFRCHRSHIISLGKIVRLELGPQMYALLDTHTRLEVSRQNRSRMKELYNK
jgi:two-component system, LytTR family, response regulator